MGIVLLLACAALPACGQRAESLVRPKGYVGDFAHVISARTAARLNRLCGEVERETHDRIDLVTVTTTGGEPIEQYAVSLQKAWGRGDREAMVIVAVGQRQRWIAAQSGLATALSRTELNKISGQMVPMLRNNDFDGAMVLAANELAAGMTASAGVKMKLRLPWGAPAVVPDGDRWVKPAMWILSLVLFASLGVWAYASGLGDALRRKIWKRTGEERR
jgi:uncharacterized protein